MAVRAHRDYFGAPVIVAAHPDDEVIGCASILLRYNGECRIVHVTDGAPRNSHDALAAGCRSREEYARVRRAEVAAALACPGVRPVLLDELGFVDQETSHHLDELIGQLADLFRRCRPICVITHPYEGGHPDHDSAALAVHAAVRLLRRECGAGLAAMEMTSYHAGPRGIETGRFLEGARGTTVLTLTAPERRTKRAMLDCFATQQQTLAWFSNRRERFRVAPTYRFIDPPHGGRLFYEQFDWGIDGATWRVRAAQALAARDLDPTACH